MPTKTGKDRERGMAMSEREWRDSGFRGTASNRGHGPDLRHPPTGELGGAARDIVRFLQGAGGEAVLGDIVRHVPGADRAGVERAVADLEEATIVEVDRQGREPRVRLTLPVDG